MPELRIEDLLTKCNDCDGRGDLHNPVPSHWTEYGANNGSTGAPCSKCESKGATLTPTGELVRDFVKWLNRTDQLPMLQ